MARKGMQGFPTWVQTIGASLDEGATITVSCTGCGRWQDVDLVKLVRAKGRAYSLINRRCRCRLKPGCDGWNRFHFKSGVMRPLWDEAAVYRWMAAG